MQRSGTPCLHRDLFAVRGFPAPCAGAVAALHHPFLVDLGDDLAVAGQQRFGRAHLRAHRQLALGETIGAVFVVFLRRVVGLGPAGAIGALVHLAAGAEIAYARVLRRAERAGVDGDGVGTLGEHDRIGALRIFAAQILALVPAAEVERHPGDALADALGDQGLHAPPRGVLDPRDPDPAAVLDAAVGGIGRVDLDEHVLLQFGEPLVGPGFLAAAFVFDAPPRAQDQRELLGDALFDRRLLHPEADVGQAELAGLAPVV